MGGNATGRAAELARRLNLAINKTVSYNLISRVGGPRIIAPPNISDPRLNTCQILPFILPFKQSRSNQWAVERGDLNMTRKKAVKVRKWITCAEPGCKRRAGTSKPYCGEHQEKFEKQKGAADSKTVTKKTRREMKEAVKKKMKKKQAGKKAISKLSRLIKAYCEGCGYTIRLSRKWIEVKRPICPVCVKNMVTQLDNEAPDPRQLPLKPVKKGRADPDAAKKIGEALKGGV